MHRLTKSLLVSSLLGLAVIIFCFVLNYRVQSLAFSWQSNAVELSQIQKAMFALSQAWSHYFYIFIPIILIGFDALGLINYFLKGRKKT